MTDLKECIHGIIWQTCNICKEKSEEVVNKEISDFGDGSVKSNIKYDYTEVVEELPTLEVDNAYDLDDSSEF